MPCFRWPERNFRSVGFGQAERNFGCRAFGGSKVSSDALSYVVIEVVNFCGLAVLEGCSFYCSSAPIPGVDFDLSKLRSEVKYLRREVQGLRSHLVA